MGGGGTNQGILLLVFPFHVLLLIAHGIPPDIQQPLAPLAPADQERSEIEAAAVLWDYQVDALRAVVADGTVADFIEMGVFEFRRRVGDVEGVVEVDVAVGDVLEMAKDMRLQRDRRLHDESVEVHPPEPETGCREYNKIVSCPSSRGKKVCRSWVRTYHSALGCCLIVCLITSTFSQLSLHSCAYRFFVLMSLISK